MNGIEVLGKTDRQSLSSSGVILVEDYTEWLHTPPDFTAICGGLGCDSNLLAQALIRFRARTALLAQRLLGRGLERFSLELSVLF